jgi:hypothetical protein
MSKDYYRRWCNTCLCVHWLEISPNSRETCHGSNYFPHDDLTQYIKSAPGGGIRVIEKTTFARQRPVQPLPLEWQLLQDAEF